MRKANVLFSPVERPHKATAPHLTQMRALMHYVYTYNTHQATDVCG